MWQWFEEKNKKKDSSAKVEASSANGDSCGDKVKTDRCSRDSLS